MRKLLAPYKLSLKEMTLLQSHLNKLREKFTSASDFCSCMEGDMDDFFPEAMKELEDFLLSCELELIEEIRGIITEELEIQKKVYEKSKEIVVVGRARVAGMVAEKYTRIGKIEALSDLLQLLDNYKK